MIIGNGKCSSGSSGFYLLLPSCLQFHITCHYWQLGKEKKPLAGMTWVFYIISKVSDYCLTQEIVANSLLVKEYTAWEILRWCSWSPNRSYYQSLTTDLLHYWKLSLFYSIELVSNTVELTFVVLRSFCGGHCSFYLCIYIVAEGEVRTVGSSPGAFPNRRALWRFSTVLSSWCDTELWKRIGGGNLQQRYSGLSSCTLFVISSI